MTRSKEIGTRSNLVRRLQLLSLWGGKVQPPLDAKEVFVRFLKELFNFSTHFLTFVCVYDSLYEMHSSALYTSPTGETFDVPQVVMQLYTTRGRLQKPVEFVCLIEGSGTSHF